jgi:hypothetical protein
MIMSRYGWIHAAIVVVMILYTGVATWAFFLPEFMKDMSRHAWWIFLLPGVKAPLSYAFLAIGRSRDRKRMKS